ncbi:MAG: nicotinamide-nucleotide amidohydrolase family protein [Victivallaceae bacterium]|nr:nicotinamide-nucleotide amidohydrolase family protein [Victivallaceae bacterium]
MKTTTICTGSELLKGTTVNTNMATIGVALTELGMPPEQGMVVADDPNLMTEALKKLAPESDLIITSGGLGPTCDDLTRKVVCDFLRMELEENRQLHEELTRRWNIRRPNQTPPPEYYFQSLAPRNAIILNNSVGSAPGMLLESTIDGKQLRIAMLPGPPGELIPMLEDELIPQLRKLSPAIMHTTGFLLAGIPEMEAEKKIQPLLTGTPVELALCASLYGVKVFFSGSDHALVQQKAAEVADKFGSKALEPGSINLIEDISKLLLQRKLTLCTAESCTGGMIATAITDLPGASQLFRGSIIAYHNEVKEQLLGVDKTLLETAGAVSADCVEQMVAGACHRFSATAGIAVSGIAGPTGGTAEKPVGLIYIAAQLNGKRIVKQFNFTGNRQMIRERTVAKALLILREMIIE